MTAPTRLAAFGFAAAVTLGGGAALGAAAGPSPTPTPTVHSDHEELSMPTTTLATDTHAGHQAAAATTGYRLHADTAVIPAGQAHRLTFRVIGPDGSAITAFDDRHERPLHLILVAADLATYAHLHPGLDPDGTWSVPLPALGPGGYRLIADTAVSGGPELVLTTDFVVPGTADASALPAPTSTVTVDDLTVDLALAAAGGETSATLTVRRGGIVIDPDPYLGARGHLVAIAADDLGYLHVHPDDDTGTEAVSFSIAAHEPGRYRLFFDFSIDGEVHTAAFTVDLDTSTPTTPTAPAAATHSHAPGDEHR